jgi:hypothetical protein
MGYYKLRSIEQSMDRTIRLRFENGGWAFMTFQENLESDWWNIVISSDWGQWNYSWTRGGMGCDIYEFMGRGRVSLDYFINKFTSGQKEYLHFDETMAQLKNALIVYCGADPDGELISDLEEMEETDSINVFYLTLPQEIHEIISDFSIISDCVVSGLSPCHTYFFDHIFPLFIDEIVKIKELNKE